MYLYSSTAQTVFFVLLTVELEFIASLSAIVVCFFTSIEIGLMTALGISMLVFLFRSARPKMRRLVRLMQNEDENLLAHVDKAHCDSGEIIFQIQGSLLFSNAGYVLDRIFKAVMRETSGAKQERKEMLWSDVANEDKTDEEKPQLQRVILDFQGVNRIDTTGLQMLVDLGDVLRIWSNGECQLSFALVNSAVLKHLNAFGLLGEYSDLSSEDRWILAIESGHLIVKWKTSVSDYQIKNES